MEKRKRYSTDLSDKEWALLEAHLPEKRRGKHSQRERVNAVLYVVRVVRTGCAWRLLPHDFPAWTTVYTYFRKLERAGVWQALNDALREQVRQQSGRERQPSAAIIDSQSVKTTEKGGHAE